MARESDLKNEFDRLAGRPTKRPALAADGLAAPRLGIVARIRASIKRAVVTALWTVGAIVGGGIGIIALSAWLGSGSQPNGPTYAVKPNSPPTPAVLASPASPAAPATLRTPAPAPSPTQEVTQIAMRPAETTSAAAPIVAERSAEPAYDADLKAVEPLPGPATHVWIKPYRKLDGTFVEGHWRKKSQAELNHDANVEPPKAVEQRPIFTETGGGGGTVQVKGYYRKNGTYVAPYTRKAPSKRK